MKPARLKLILILLGLCALGLPVHAETDQEVAARATALDVAGAFSNDGFKIRDGHWVGTIAPNENKTFAVNLYSGNQYWFSIGASQPVKRIAVDVFDETGAPVTTEKYHADGKAAAGLSVANSGQYFIRVRLEDGAPAAICFVYSYK